jgi:hypothetical protein
VDVEIKKLLRDIEQLGEMGKVEEIEKFTEEVERLKGNKEDLQTLAQNPTLAAKHMKVCEICGAMQAINDTETRNQNHLEGKVHTGFAKLRKELVELKNRKQILKLIAKAQHKKRQEMHGDRRKDTSEGEDEYERGGRGRHRERRHGRRDRRERSRDKDKERERGHRDRDKDKDRDDHKKRKKEKKRKHRDRSRDRDRY